MSNLDGDLRELENQHQEISGVSETLKEFLQHPRPAAGTGAGQSWAHQLAEKITQLHEKLSRHFREEERSGCLEELAENFPEATRATQVLLKEHDRILSDLRTILGATMVYSEGKEPENPRIRRWTLSLLQQLGRHEHEETELFQKHHYRDLGGAD